MVTFYTTNCPKCKILKTKLDEANINYSVVTDVDKMLELGMKSAPGLKVDDGPLMTFGEAVKWVKENNGAN